MANGILPEQANGTLKDELMATNTGKGYRRGPVKDRSQVKNPTIDRWSKRGPDGRFMDQKSDNKPFKGITKEG